MILKLKFKKSTCKAFLKNQYAKHAYVYLKKRKKKKVIFIFIIVLCKKIDSVGHTPSMKNKDKIIFLTQEFLSSNDYALFIYLLIRYCYKSMILNKYGK